MALPPVPPIYFDAEEILATRGECLNHLKEHLDDLRHAEPCARRSYRSFVQVALLAGAACISGYLFTVYALPIAG